MVSPMNSPHSPRGARRWITAGFFAGTLALVPVLVACGSSSNSDDTSASTSTTLPETRTRTLDKVTVEGFLEASPQSRLTLRLLAKKKTAL